MNIATRNNSSLSKAYRPGFFDDQFGRMVEHVFDGFLTPFSRLSGTESAALSTPRLNVSETDRGYEIEAELPGIAKEDIKVSVDGQRVSIEAESKHESEKKDGERVIYAERSARKFARSFTLPAEVDDANADAKFENGILTLRLPKKQSAQPKKLSIQ
jgi:HSP20 family protein